MIWLILTLAFLLRLITINQSLWLDEAININVTKFLSYKSLVLNYSLGDFHPPLYHLILKSWILLFGSSEISARLISVILGVATVFVTYLIAKKLFEKKTALIAATLLATAPLHIYYSQEARMYVLAGFLASLSVYFFVALLKNDILILWVGFILSTAFMLYSDYLPYLLIPTYFVYLAIFKKNIAKSTLKCFIPAFIVIFLLLIPWLIVLPRQVQVGLSAAAASPAWAQVVGTPNIQNFLLTFVKFTIGRISVDNNLIYFLLFLPIGLFVLFLSVLSIFRLSSLRSFLWFWLLTPIILGFVIGYFVPIFTYFRFIFVLPAFYIILSAGVRTINWVVSTRILLIIVLVINLTAASLYFTVPKFQRENWRLAVSLIHKNSTPKTIVLFESNYSVAPFDYYNKDQVKTSGALSGFSADPNFIRDNIEKLTQDKDKVFLFQYLSGITDPAGLVFEELTKSGFKNITTHNFNGVGFVYEFIRQ